MSTNDSSKNERSESAAARCSTAPKAEPMTEEELTEWSDLYRRVYARDRCILSGLRGWKKKWVRDNDPEAGRTALGILRSLEKIGKLKPPPSGP